MSGVVARRQAIPRLLTTADAHEQLAAACRKFGEAMARQIDSLPPDQKAALAGFMAANRRAELESLRCRQSFHMAEARRLSREIRAREAADG